MTFTPRRTQFDMELSESHVMLVRVLGVLLFCSGLFSLFTREAFDATIALSIAFVRILVCSIIMMTILYECSVTSKRAIKFHRRHLYVNCFAICAVIVGSAKQLFTCVEFNNYPQYAVRINSALMVDSILTALQGCFCLLYPDFSMKIFTGVRPDRLHLQFVREIGIFMLGLSVLSIKACGFLHEDHKRKIFGCKILLYMGLMATAYLYTLSSVAIGILSTVSSLMVMNSIIGYWSFGTAGYPILKKY